MAIVALSRSIGKGDVARDRIKQVARELFALYGLDKVTIRDIAKSAGQRNGGSVNYYFRSKEDLILEILNDAAEASDIGRSHALDALEASGEPITVRSILKVLVSARGMETEENMRLFTMLQIYRRDFMHTEIPGRWDRAYQRCLVHLKRMLPDYPEKIVRQRLYFMVPYLWTFLATREGGQERAKFWQEFWQDPSSMESLLDTAEGMLVYPPSAETLAVL